MGIAQVKPSTFCLPSKAWVTYWCKEHVPSIFLHDHTKRTCQRFQGRNLEDLDLQSSCIGYSNPSLCYQQTGSVVVDLWIASQKQSEAGSLGMKDFSCARRLIHRKSWCQRICNFYQSRLKLVLVDRFLHVPGNTITYPSLSVPSATLKASPSI